MVEELKEEITRLESEGKQMLANANFMAGAMHAYSTVLKKLEENKEKTDGEHTGSRPITG